MSTPDRAPGDAPVVAVADERRLRAALADSARRLSSVRTDSSDSESMLDAIVAGALRAIPAVAAASITLIGPDGTITTKAPSDDLIADLDAVQAVLCEGPCIDASRADGGGVTDVVDLGADDGPAPCRWPRFTPHVRSAGFASVLSYRLSTPGSIGALNLWAVEPGRFSDQDRHTAPYSPPRPRSRSREHAGSGSCTGHSIAGTSSGAPRAS